MSRSLYLECASGISGDMTVGALLDLGASRAALDRALRNIAPGHLRCSVSRKNVSGLSACDFLVELEEEHHHEHHHEHRNLADVCEVIGRADMTARARELAVKMFRIVAEAEAEAHGKSIEEVHFHEVGALDSLADIIGAAVLYDDLDPDSCIVSGLAEGSGFVTCQHGELPVPVPAVLNIARKYSIALRPSGEQGEMVTPTGIAIAAALRTDTELPEEYVIEKTGLGAGKRVFRRPNLLRAMLLRSTDTHQERIVCMECGIDDSTGETLGYAMEQLFAAGARDVCFIPCFMKKNRPAYLLKILTDESLLAKMEETLFRTTSTIGLRSYPVKRTVMEREIRTVTLPAGEVKVKCCTFGALRRYYPEYESVRELALRSGLDLHTLYELAAEQARHEKL